MAESSVTAVGTTAPVSQSRISYVDWPAILAGAVVASAVAFVLTAFGTGLGLSLVSPYRGEGMPGTGFVIAAGLWIVWATATSFLAGGYVAGRLRHRVPEATEHEVGIRDGAHGAIVWALATLIGAGLLALGVYGTANMASQATSAAATTASAAPAQVGGDQASRGGDPYAVVVAQMFGPGEESTKPGAEAARRVAARIMTTGVAEGNLRDADRSYLVKLIETRSGVDEATARGRVDQAFKDSQAIADKAKQAADVARKTGIVSGFVIAASLLIGLVAAWWAADRGGRHRDQRTVFSWLQFR